MEYIKDSLIFYDKSRFEFDLLYPKITSIKFDDDKSDLKKSKVIINNDAYYYNVIGRFDNFTNFWEWSWSFEKIKNKIYDIDDLLNYARELFDDEYDIYRNILINTKIKINEKINLDIILAITIRFMMTKKYVYILKLKDTNNIDKYIIVKKI